MSSGPRIDMSPEAITARLKEAATLWRASMRLLAARPADAPGAPSALERMWISELRRAGMTEEQQDEILVNQGVRPRGRAGS